jgi:hypothetical protein
MSPYASPRQMHGRWKPHPDDEADVRQAVEAAERGELLSPSASQTFLRWLEGGDDDSWRAESE